jgi:flavin reductase (DIM6/NTAB) family NADH-FMN oxidoreductase RutF
MNKRKMGPLPLMYTIPTVLVGTQVEGIANFSVVGNCGLIAVEPAVLYISSNRAHHTNKGIKQTGCFSVNIPSRDLLERTDYCGLVSGATVDKSQVFATFPADDTGAPMIAECPLNLDCRVIKEFSLFDMELFIARIVESYLDPDCLKRGVPDIERIAPIVYSIDNRYWELGRCIGKSFSIGRSYKKKVNG